MAARPEKVFVALDGGLRRTDATAVAVGSALATAVERSPSTLSLSRRALRLEEDIAALRQLLGHTIAKAGEESWWRVWERRRLRRSCEVQAGVLIDLEHERAAVGRQLAARVRELERC